MSEKTVLSLHAHPDDTELSCAGTLAILREKGWNIHIATMTPGDCGTMEYGREEISKIRKAESADAAKLLEAGYTCLECDDVFIMYDRKTIKKVIALLRKVKPTLVFAPSPADYMIDHETTSALIMTGCFSCGMPNIETPGLEPYNLTPHLYYVEPLEGKDKFGQKVQTQMRVDITRTIDIKEKMLCCQRLVGLKQN